MGKILVLNKTSMPEGQIARTGLVLDLPKFSTFRRYYYGHYR